LDVRLYDKRIELIAEMAMTDRTVACSYQDPDLSRYRGLVEELV
jgi:hypothetical protein